MSGKTDYQIRFFEKYLEEMLVSADSVEGAVRLAEEIAAELTAKHFSITALPPKISDFDR